MSSRPFPSPRGSASKSSPSSSCSSRYGGGFGDGSIANRMVWIHVFAAVAVVIILYLLAREKYNDVHSWARVPAVISNPVILCLYVLASLVLAGCATSMGAKSLDQRWSVVVQGLFMSISVIFVVNAYLVYRIHNFLGAFYLSILAFVLLMIHAYAMMRVSRTAVLALVPLIVFVGISVYLLWYMADESSDSIATSIPVFEV